MTINNADQDDPGLPADDRDKALKKPPAPPKGGPKGSKGAREARLARALRDNLRRRKAACRTREETD